MTDGRPMRVSATEGRLVLLALAAAGAWLVPRAALAQPILEGDRIAHDDETDPNGHYYRSPKNFAYQLTFGPYRPDVDSEFSASGRHPYQDFFGSGNDLMSQMELDYQVFHKMGSIAVGLGLGFFQVTGKAPIAGPTGALSGDNSTLTVVPISLSAVYRFDYYLERKGFPLVPYAKLGLDYAYWQITDGNDDIATDGRGGRARGGTAGWHAAAGLAMVIDMLDPDAARSFDNEIGVNHTAIVFEYGHYDISGLGEADRLHLGDNTWTLGILLEF